MAAQKKADVWMPLWIGAYMGDTMKLTTLQHGAYLLLLMAYWRERAPLADDDDELRAITKLERSEWKKARPVLAKFFRVEAGVWWHKRVEAEMAEADKRAKHASDRASNAAKARWGGGSEHGEEHAPSMLQASDQDAPSMLQASQNDAPSNAPGNAQTMLEQCPTPSPIQVTNTNHTQGPATTPPQLSGPVCVGSGADAQRQDPGPQQLTAGQVAYRLQEAGMVDARVTSSLRALLDAGTTLADLLALVPKAMTRASPFNWLLSVAGTAPAPAAVRAAPAAPVMPAPPATSVVRGGESATAYLAQQDAAVAQLATPEVKAAADVARRNCVERSRRALTEAQLAAPVASASEDASERAVPVWASR